jgi:Ulp1 family protease
MFINIKKKKISFFDSVGETAPKEVMALVERIKKQGLNLKKPIIFKFDQNHPKEHQYGDTECGIYSLYFIVHLLEDKHTLEYFKSHVLSDKYMEKFRKVYFNRDL